MQCVRFAAIICTLALALGGGAVGAPADDTDSTLTARQLFYTERPKPAKPAARTPKPRPATPSREREPSAPADTPKSAAGEERYAPHLGLRYSLLQVDAKGRLDEVNPDKAFRAQDAIKLRLSPNSDGYLYIVHQGSSGKWEVLFPSPKIRSGSNEVSRLQTVVIPAGDQDFVFDNKPGVERLFVVLSATPERDLDELIYSLRGGEQRQRTLIASTGSIEVPAQGIERFRAGLVSRDLRVERRPTVESKREEAVFVVNTSESGDNRRVVAEINLRHQ